MGKKIGMLAGVLAAPFTGGASLLATAGLGAAGALAGGAIEKALGGGGSPTPTPAASTGPVVMPLADDAKILAARKKAAAAKMSRGGRTSTMLTSDSSGDKLGG